MKSKKAYIAVFVSLEVTNHQSIACLDKHFKGF